MVRFLIPVHALANDQQGQLLDDIPVSASSDKNRRILYKKDKNTMRSSFLERKGGPSGDRMVDS